MYDQSPIRISSKINIPDIATPISFKTPNSETSPFPSAAKLIKARAEVLSLKDDKLYN